MHVWVPCSIHPSKDSRYSIYLFGNQTMFCIVLSCMLDLFYKRSRLRQRSCVAGVCCGTALEKKRKRSVSNYETCEKPKKIPDSSYLHINFHRCRCHSRLFMSFYSSSSLLEWRENVTGLQSTVYSNITVISFCPKKSVPMFQRVIGLHVQSFSLLHDRCYTSPRPPPWEEGPAHCLNYCKRWMRIL